MPKETQFKSRLIKALKVALPNAEIVNMNAYGGMVEKGIPDFTVTRFDTGPWSKTVWVETKVLPSKNQMFKPIQLERLKRLGGWYVVWHTDNMYAWMFRADEYEYWSDGEVYDFDELVGRIARFF